jgi:aspartate kinase
MQPVVLKFGGTSVADGPAIRQVVGIVRRARTKHPAVVVVVSALAKVTDGLLAACAAARDGETHLVEDLVSSIEARHRDVVEDLFGRDASMVTDVWGDIIHYFHDLRSVLTSVAILREVTPRGTDRVAAAGELISSRMVTAALQAEGSPARWVDPRRTLVTDSRSPALPLTDETGRAAANEIAPVLGGGGIAVTGGFVGATSEGITTTLGRGGSDLSAAILGAALHAREIQIWTDVDGLLTADPRVVDDAQVVPELSFDEASELAYFGAKVLHPSTILPAVDRAIPVRILNTRRPEGRGSLILPRATDRGRTLTAIACKRHVTVVDVTSPRMLQAHGFLRRVFEVFERHETSVDVVTTSEVSVSVTIDDTRRIDAIERDLAAFASVRVERGLAIVCAVGDQLRHDPLTAGRVLGTLERFPLRMVSQAASRRNVTVVLSDSDVPAAMGRLHETFFSREEAVP